MERTEIPIPVPCEVRLEDMQRREPGRRYCEHCQKVVHFLSALTEREAKAFLERAANDDVCVSYAHDASGKLLFLPERRGRFVRLPVAVGVAAAVAACSPSKSQGTDHQKPAVVASATAADCENDKARHAELERKLADAKDEQERAKLEAELAALHEEIVPGPSHHVVAGKMQMRPPDGASPRTPPGKNKGCACPPGDPLCSCL